MATPSKQESREIPQEVIAALESVVDPEIPVLTIRDLGVLRDVRIEGDRVVVTITPTYVGCPAMLDIQDSIKHALAEVGHADAVIETRLAPAWTTDWMSAEGREKLRAYGIAPPGKVDPGQVPRPFRDDEVVSCPQCGSDHTKIVSEFGSTACKALYKCEACLEPFDYFKCH